MSTVYICDGCGKQLDFFEMVRVTGSKNLRDTLFCTKCFKRIEKYIIGQFKLVDTSQNKLDEQYRSQTN